MCVYFCGLSQEYFLPSVDHVRVVRMLVKHVHSFVYAKGPDMSHFSNIYSTDELRWYVRVEFLGNHMSVRSSGECWRQGSLWREGLVCLLMYPWVPLYYLKCFKEEIMCEIVYIIEGLSCKIFDFDADV